MSVTMLPSGGFVSGFNPNSGGNSFVEPYGQMEVVPEEESSSPQANIGKDTDALTALYNLAQNNPAYWDAYLQLLAERENTTSAQQWYERMSSSQYQRAMADLQKAGLNPLLAITSLSGAGSGSVQPAGTWSTSPYSNATEEKSRKDTKSQNQIKNALQAIALVFGFSAGILKTLGSS